jgi:cytochrome c5
MSEHDAETSFIKTPQQLVVVVVLSFLVPIIGIILLVQLVTGGHTADPSALTPDAVAARILPVGKLEFGAAPGAGGARSGEEIVKGTCFACHGTGAAGAPKVGDKAAWAPRIAGGLQKLLASAIKGKGAMPPKGGASDVSDYELARAIVYMANQSGGSLKEPPAPKADAKK